MTLLLCAATARELAGLAPGFAPPGLPPLERTGAGAAAAPWPEMRLWPLPLRRGRALCCLTGVGPLNAALALGLALERAAAEGTPISAVCNAGLAGAFDLAAAPLRSLWLVREEIWPEYGLNDGRSVVAGAFGFPLWQPPEGAPVRDRLPLAGADALGTGAEAAVFPSCRSVTVAGVTASHERAAGLRQSYGAELENMEGFAVAYACARAGLPCVEARCVSNKAGPRAGDEKDFAGALRALAQVLPALNCN
ncbi:futalosine hydrolase [Desulfovibrio legallii]|uniref:Futalosine hydrolase n=1 Tax=Desulfovibrio legallii TaxID=571438 RepID=A0A1G7NVJ7_9BACT|nr:futalosine hydrolase [Desulfovibrio legallii]SDF78042.1 futalosine hydrolase [Desulfovibrio legallii]